MRRPDLEPRDTTERASVRDRAPEVPLQDGSLQPVCPLPVRPITSARSRSGILERPLNRINRPAVKAEDTQTELERFKVGLRKYSPVQKGIAGLPWSGTWHCGKCDEQVPGRFVYDEVEDAIYLVCECPSCGPYRQRHYDQLFVKNPPPPPPGPNTRRQPKQTYSGFPIHPIVTGLPRTVETLCPECSCLILGRNFVRDGAVWMEKTCPEHGYFRDKINSDVDMYLRATRAGFQDERGVYKPQVTGGQACPSDCGLCGQHHSTSCLAQIDLTNRCNLTCPICFASANEAGYVAEPSYEMVVEYLQTLREQHPCPATAIQFTGGEPTIHPDFHRIVKKSNEMGFSHVQIATNGIAIANPEFAARAADAGLHTLYLQFDGLDDALYKQLRAQPLLDIKMAAIENCRRLDMKICLVPTVVKGFNDDQVGKIFRFAADNADVISAIAYQPVAFTGRISRHDLESKRYTLGDLAHDVAAVSGADPRRDFFPLNHIAPLSRIMQTLDGKPKIRSSCHSDCAFGSYFFVAPDGQTIPIPKLFDTMKLFRGFNELAAKIERTRPQGMATWRDKLEIALTFLRSYRWTERDFRVTPFTFMRTLRGMTNKAAGRGTSGQKTYRTLMAAGMHFMDRYNYDTQRVRRCVILYSTPDGVYPFCTINGGPTYRPLLEKMITRSVEQWQADNPGSPVRPPSDPNAYAS
ncbi:MAG: tetraether lipid synthase Tes [Planctomycetota bacterium]